MTQQEFLSRRQTLLAQMQPGSAALIFAAPEAVRSADSEYPYRQNSDFWYFTGFNEPEALLVLIKSDETHNHSVLFNRVRDLTAEIWFGRRLGQEAAPAKLGVDRALAFSEINQQLYQLLNGLDAIYFARVNMPMPMRLCSTPSKNCAKARARICRRRTRLSTGGPLCMRCACLNPRKSLP
nr:Xaa-Pro aminopeptidase [Klebsiella pneumoniae]